MAQLTIKERQAGDVTILDLAGKITIGEGDVVLREEVNKLLESDRKNILLNLDKVTYMDSAGIGELVLFCQGSSARLAANLREAPVDAVIIGIVDSVDVLGKQIYSART